MDTKTLYKVTGPDGESIHGGSFTYPLPTDAEPGAWTPEVSDVAAGTRGYHLTTEIGRWMKVGCRIWEAEGRGASSRKGDKVAFESVRLIREVASPKWWTNVNEFIATISDIPFLKPQGDPDPSWKVFDTRDAAWAAARDAWDAGDAARDAGAAAWAAARDAGDAWAAGDAGAAAWAAGDAARDAAWAAARAAWDAGDAGDAWDAARAARDAWDAELMARCFVVADLIEPEHLEHAKARWDVWQRGYGLIGDVDGVLYVYRKGV